MKTIRTEKQPAVPSWALILMDYPVRIPNSEGTGFSEIVPVKIEAWKNEDGEIIVPGDVKAALEELKARYMGLLLPQHMRELREHLGLTQKQIADLLQLGEKTWTRWESGRERPSRSMNILLQALCDGRIDANYLGLLKEPALRTRPVAYRQSYRAAFTAYEFSVSSVQETCDEAVPS